MGHMGHIKLANLCFSFFAWFFIECRSVMQSLRARLTKPFMTNIAHLYSQLRRDWHMLTACFICGPKWWFSLLYVNIYISLEQCPKGKSRVIFDVKRIKLTRQKKKLKKNFMRRKMILNFWIRNLAICRWKMTLNLHLPAYVHIFWVGLKQPQHYFKSVLFFLGQQKDNLLDRTKC